MGKIRVLVADDHNIVRDGLRELINNQPDMEMIGHACNGKQALTKVRTLRPDVILLDIAMPEMNGLVAVRLIMDISPATQVVIFSMHKKNAYVQQALTSGARGYVLKTSPSSQIFDAIRSVHRGKYFLSPSVQADVIDEYLVKNHQVKVTGRRYDALSEREQGVFRLMVEGHPTKEMADLLCISPKTVEKHRSAVMKKLGFKSIFDMMKYAVKIGIVDPDLWDE